MGYEDGNNTYYIVPDMEGSTKIIIDSSQGVVNRLDYDHLGKIRNQTAPPQVELLWRGWFYSSGIELYIGQLIHFPLLGFIILPRSPNNNIYNDNYFSIITDDSIFPSIAGNINIPLSLVLMIFPLQYRTEAWDYGNPLCQKAIEDGYKCFLLYRALPPGSTEREAQFDICRGYMNSIVMNCKVRGSTSGNTGTIS